MKSKKNLILFLFCLTVITIIPTICFASMPWDTPLTTIKDDLTGPVAQGVTVITIVITGLMIAFGEGGAAGRKMMQIVFGMACALGGAQVISSVFSSSTSSSGVIFRVLQ